MTYKALSPRIALNKAYLKVRPSRENIEKFKTNLKQLLSQINESESEEFHKNIISKFLDTTFYGPNYYINTKGKTDLVIHSGKDAKSPVAIIVETKKPTNKPEMVSKSNLNTKAFQELVLYFMRERITGGNLQIKHLLITNIYEWYFFDATMFEKAFVENKEFVKNFKDFEEKRLSGTNTDFFYKQIAEPAINELIKNYQEVGKEVEFTYFDIRDYEKVLRNADRDDDKQLIALFKLLSPDHLLKLPLKNDSNTLDGGFYKELLHIIGLTPVDADGKKLIQRKKLEQRDAGSLLENTISKLDSMGKVRRLEKPSLFGSTNEERFFNLGLELVITWINRILFLKLLEAQLTTYHKGDRNYAFLNSEKVKTFDDLNELFLEILAKEPSKRTSPISATFENVPYLNSSLFEDTEIEHQGVFISQLQQMEMPILSNTVLKDANGKRVKGSLNTLEYLFSFLDAYDFSSEGSEDIQEENKTLISASVLGLIFEKINGYKDGSFFTPGFITMYMSRETIRKAVVQKFNTIKGWNCGSISELYDKIQDKKEANSIINSLTLIDPAVGSGHFLVSALNEIISIKAELAILLDRTGKTLRDYNIDISNDELSITDEEGRLFKYNPKNKESQRVQEALFHEKQTIIEKCLFGVDINNNSVKICQLRLWIELLKNAYYKEDTGFSELETLPNIDINIKSGNSLVSRYDLDIDISEALKKSKYSIRDFIDAHERYRHARSKDEKRDMDDLIKNIKADFRSEISNNDPLVKKLRSRRGELDKLRNQHLLFELSKSEAKVRKDKEGKLDKEVTKLEADIDEIRASKIFENALEWRFEFPEVLDNEGNFLGFDVVIGNPPYIRIQELKQSNTALVDYYNKKFESAGKGNYDIYIPFIELGYKILHQGGHFCFIMPHKFTSATYGENVRKFIVDKNFLQRVILFGAQQVFEDATTYTGLFFMHKGDQTSYEFYDCSDFSDLAIKSKITFDVSGMNTLSAKEWLFLNTQHSGLLLKLKQNHDPLEKFTNRIFQGLKTSADKIYILEKRNETPDEYIVLCKQDDLQYTVEKKFVYPLIKGGDSRPFQILPSDLLILFPYRDGKLLTDSELKEEAPLTWMFLNKHKSYLENRENGKMKGGNWYAYIYPKALNLIHQPKIFTPDIAPSPRFSYDIAGQFLFTGGVSGGYGIIPEENISTKYLLAVLNGSVCNWYIRKTSTPMRGNWFSYEARYIKSIPIPEIPEQVSVIEDLVDKILIAKQSDQETKAMELELDDIIISLYDLTSEEKNAMLAQIN